MKTNDVLTNDLRGTLKQWFAGQLENLPAHFENLEPKEKMDYLLKLMPFVLPKISSVDHDLDEADIWEL